MNQPSPDSSGNFLPQFIWNPIQLSYWGSDKYPMVVVAEEAFAKACYPPQVFITDETAVAWATQNNVLYGCDIGAVMPLMMQDGFHQGGKVYCNGAFTQVDWHDEKALQSAISRGPVKVGIDATQLRSVWVAGKKGWVATGLTATSIPNTCASLCGYGTTDWLAQELNTVVPQNVDGNTPAYALYFLNSIGIVDAESIQKIVGEAWLRAPTTVVR